MMGSGGPCSPGGPCRMDDTIWSQPVLVVPFSGSVTGTATLRGSGWPTGEETCSGGRVWGEELTGRVAG